MTDGYCRSVVCLPERVGTCPLRFDGQQNLEYYDVNLVRLVQLHTLRPPHLCIEMNAEFNSQGRTPRETRESVAPG